MTVMPRWLRQELNNREMLKSWYDPKNRRSNNTEAEWEDRLRAAGLQRRESR